MPVAELLLASLSVGVALLCFTFALLVVPRITLPAARRPVRIAFRGTAGVFSILGGVVNLLLAVQALSNPEPVGVDDLALPALLFVGGSLFVPAAIRYLDINVVTKASARELRVRELERLAMRDPLTGAHNRRYFNEELGNEIRRYRRYDRPVSIVVFDVDDLKSINDRGGHAAGDRVLTSIAVAAEKTIRRGDSVARLGGDEFALILPETDQSRASLAAERLRAAVEELSTPVGGHASISVGVASVPRDGHTAEQLEARADQALYWVKKHGKNRCAAASSLGARSSGVGASAAT